MVTITTSGKLVDEKTGACVRCRVDPDNVVDSTTSLTPSSDYMDQMLPPSGCWHSGWAEIKIRRSSGNTAWMMRLQNRPYPLSLTHPSSLGMPESELGLLAASFPPEGAVKLQVNVQEIVGEKKRRGEEEFFFSQEVGSFTDISFASNFPREVHGGGDGGRERSDTVTSHGEADRGDERRKEEKEDISVGVSSLSSGKDGNGETGGVELGEAGTHTPGLLSISEAAAIVDDNSPTEQDHPAEDKPESTEDAQATEESGQPVPGKASVLSAMAPHVRRPVNSQSWSEKVQTTPVPITPRASSYSFSMEQLPPLLSYDGVEEEFRHSPSLHEGGRVMSEEEQVGEYNNLTV